MSRPADVPVDDEGDVAPERDLEAGRGGHPVAVVTGASGTVTAEAVIGGTEPGSVTVGGTTAGAVVAETSGAASAAWPPHAARPSAATNSTAVRLIRPFCRCLAPMAITPPWTCSITFIDASRASHEGRR